MTTTPSSLSGRRIAVSGADGLVGSALLQRLESLGAQPVRLVRRPPRDPNLEVQWSQERGLLDPARLEGVAAVVHLAGENVAGGRWTAARKQRIRDSRVIGTEALCTSLARLSARPETLVCASATGFYGDRGDEVLDESSPSGQGFLPEVCRGWEEACAPARAAGVRVVNLRIGVVLSRHGGALAKMLTPFRLGVGGRIGNGRQWMSWLSREDLVGAIVHALSRPELSGPVNAVSPQPVTNAEFTRTLGGVLRRPTIFPLPAVVARLALGQMADDLLLASVRVLPTQLQQTGYEFQHPELRSCLTAEVG